MKLVNSTAFILLAMGSVMMISCSSKEKQESAKNKNGAVTVTLASPNETANEGISASGQIEAVETANISTRVMGYIMKLNVKVGDHVKTGQVLATINSQDMSAKRAQINAMIAEAEAKIEQFTKLGFADLPGDAGTEPECHQTDRGINR